MSGTAWNDIDNPSSTEEPSSVVASLMFSVVFLAPATVLWSIASVSWFVGGFELAGSMALLFVALPYALAAFVAKRPSHYTGRAALGRFILVAGFAAIPTSVAAAILYLVSSASGVV